MATNLWTSGAANIWISGNGSASLTFLGICEDELEITITSKYKDIYADYAGGSDGVPADVTFLGSTAMIKMTLARFDMTVLQYAQSRLNESGGTLGSTGIYDIGSMMVTNSKCFRVLCYPQFYVNNSSLQIFNFPTCILDSDMILNYSTRNQKAQLLWRAIPAYTISSQGAGLTSLLYNTSTSGMGSTID